MNNKQITFIICVNNEIYFEECKFYINRLIVPEGYTVDLIAIREADSMCSAYNAGMRSSDAKYKIYMHQDVMICNIHFLEDIIKIFSENQKVGMLGVLGGTKMPKTGMTYLAWNVGIVDCRDPDLAYYLVGAADMKKENTIVEAIDGLLIATQYDISWREDLFTHFDFYDVSQSFEMRKAGYQILVPYQEIPWVIHDSNFVKLTYYNEERKICLREYAEYLYADGGHEFVYDKEWNELSDLLAEQLKDLIGAWQWEQVGKIMESYRSTERKNSSMQMLGLLYDIYRKEQNAQVKHGFFSDCGDYNSIYRKYISVRFLLRRMELGMGKETYQELSEAISTEKISCEAVIEIGIHSIIDKEKVLQELMEIYEKAKLWKCYERCRNIALIAAKKTVPVAYFHKHDKQMIEYNRNK